jgi:hypothetical protein
LIDSVSVIRTLILASETESMEPVLGTLSISETEVLSRIAIYTRTKAVRSRY